MDSVDLGSSRLKLLIETLSYAIHTSHSAMTEIKERVSCRSLDFSNQRKAYMLRHVKKQSWEKIAGQVINVSGNTPSWVCVRETLQGLSVTKGCRKFKYARCGRKPWKMSTDIQKFIIRRLVAQRANQIVTSVTLQADVASDKGVIEDSTIRKFLKKRGYTWLPRNQKRKYSAVAKAARVKFAKAVLRMSKAALRQKLSMSLDGVVLSMPPTNDTDRYNYCWGAATHMWRKHSEGNSPKLAGADDYPKQAPVERCIPVWGGISEDGFAAVHWHSGRKTNTEDWVKDVRAGKVTEALRHLNPRNKSGPWTILCDGERFLHAKASKAAYVAKKISLWVNPAKSPDLNPVEMFWGWLRSKLRLMDLTDMRQKRRTLGKTAYTARVKAVMKSQKAQAVSKSFTKRFRTACKQVVDRRGAAADN